MATATKTKRKGAEFTHPITTPFDAVRALVDGKTVADVLDAMPELINSSQWHSACCGAMSVTVALHRADVATRIGELMDHLSDWPDEREAGGKWA